MIISSVLWKVEAVSIKINHLTEETVLAVLGIEPGMCTCYTNVFYHKVALPGLDEDISKKGAENAASLL
jgi:hypothetical protein